MNWKVIAFAAMLGMVTGVALPGISWYGSCVVSALCVLVAWFLFRNEPPR